MSVLQAPEWLSPTACSTYLQCPLKFKFERIDKLPQEPSEAMLKGRFVHAIVENLLKAKVEDRDLITAKEIAKELWYSEYEKETEVLNLSADGIKDFKWSSWFCVENYFELEDPKGVSPLGTEAWVRGPIGNGKVRGVIDRYESSGDSLRIVDYKTGKKPGRKEWAEPHIFQLTIYAILLEAEKKQPVSEIALFYLGDGNLGEYDVTEKSKASVVKSINSIKEGIDERVANDSFEPRTSKLCDWCAFKPICPAWS